MRVHRSFRTTCACALAFWALTGGQAWAEQLVGVVKSIDTQQRKLVVVEDTTDRVVDVTITPDTAIAANGGRPLTLKGLKKGDGVGIAHNAGVATSILVNQAALVGVVEKVDLDAKTFVVDEKDTDRDVKVAVLPRTTIETKGGKLYTFKDLKTGDGVSVVYDGEDVARVTVNARPTELTGHVKSVAADLKSLVITEVGTDHDVTVKVTPDTAIVTDGGKTMELKQLKKGDGVGIAHDASVASKIVVNPAAAK